MAYTHELAPSIQKHSSILVLLDTGIAIVVLAITKKSVVCFGSCQNVNELGLPVVSLNVSQSGVVETVMWHSQRQTWRQQPQSQDHRRRRTRRNSCDKSINQPTRLVQTLVANVMDPDSSSCGPPPPVGPAKFCHCNMMTVLMASGTNVDTQWTGDNTAPRAAPAASHRSGELARLVLSCLWCRCSPLRTVLPSRLLHL